MCGIFGHFSCTPIPDVAVLQARLLSAQRALNHRGPDDRGLETFSISCNSHIGTLSLGHTRLSIIDLSPSGHQPMHSGDGRYTIVFNGEIYNYRELQCELKSQGFVFRTVSDTEVLLAAWAHWGVKGLRRLTGMFAFAVYDRNEQSLTLVRDAFGIKPLFYAHAANSLCFASEIPALLELLENRTDLNLQQAYRYLAYGRYDDGEESFYAGVYHLLPGHCVQLDLRSGELNKPQRWWWPSIQERSDLSFEDAASQLRNMFLNSVRLHLRSDVPLGAALSGGVDSSAVVCAMRHLDPHMPIHTFTYVARNSAVDEEHWADIVNDHVGAIAHKVVVNPNDLADDLDDMIRSQGEPFGGTSIYAQYRVFKAAREAGITVTLDGQGADELLAGYNGYPSAFIHTLIDQQRFSEVMPFLAQWMRWPGRSIHNAVAMLLRPLLPIQLQKIARKVIMRSPIPDWINTEVLVARGVYVSPSSPAAHAPDAMGRRLVAALRAALTGQGLCSLLRHGDRNSMRWTIESRVPFLTIEMAEFLLSLPESYLLGPDGETKRIFRAAMRGIVPDKILDRRDKIGFQTPEKNWLRSQNAKIEQWLSTAETLSFINLKQGREEINGMLDGSKTFGWHAWVLINFCRWVQVQGQ